MLDPHCLHGDLFGEPCGPETPDGELCGPCARARLVDAPVADSAVESAYLTGYAQGWADGTRRAGPYADLQGLADYLRALPSDDGRTTKGTSRKVSSRV